MSEVKLRKLLQPWHYDWPTFSARCPLLFRLLKPELSSTKKSGFVFWPLSDDVITNLAISIFSFVGNTTHLTTVFYFLVNSGKLYGGMQSLPVGRFLISANDFFRFSVSCCLVENQLFPPLGTTSLKDIIKRYNDFKNVYIRALMFSVIMFVFHRLSLKKHTSLIILDFSNCPAYNILNLINKYFMFIGCLFSYFPSNISRLTPGQNVESLN